MTERFQGKYRIPPARWQQWNYGDNGNYFVTICTANRNHYFGKIVLDDNAVASMQLYPAGKIAEQLWLEIPSHFPFVRLDSFVVMPNHIHGILIIDKEDQALVSLQNKTPGQQRFRSPESSSISSVLGSYKSEVTKRVRKSNELFGWQSRFHDRVIRDDAEYRRIVHYIENNVSNWVDDSYFSI